MARFLDWNNKLIYITMEVVPKRSNVIIMMNGGEYMPKVTVLGCGAVGSYAAKVLSMSNIFSEIIVGDLDPEKPQQLVQSLGSKNISAAQFDALNSGSIKNLIKGSQVVLNCVGPYYKFGVPILKASIEAGVDYVDVCDDFDATEGLLNLDEEAKGRDVSALVGMGASPGLVSVLARFCTETLLDETESVDIYHVHGGERMEGAGVVKHRIHSMLIDIPVFMDGKLKIVKMFDKSGEELEETVDLPDLGKCDVYVYAHPETITFPKYLKIKKRVTNLGLVLPPAYAELIKGIVKLGITSETPIDINGQKVAPLDFAVNFIISARERFLKEAGLTEPRGCLMMVISGKKKSEKNSYIFSISSKGAGMREGTAIPAALGAMLMGQGKIKRKGAFPAEAGVDPMDFFTLAREKIQFAGKEGIPLNLRHLGKNGKVEQVDVEKLLQNILTR